MPTPTRNLVQVAAAALTLATLTGTATARGAFTLTPIGTPSATNAAIPYAISGDGSTVVGGTASGANHFRWNRATGVELMAFPGAFRNAAVAVSFNGGTIIGNSRNLANGDFAWKLSFAQGVQVLANLPATVGSIASGVSADGSQAVGSWSSGLAYSLVRWNATGTPSGLSRPSGYATAFPVGLSADADTIALQAALSDDPNFTLHARSFVWRGSTSTYTDLGVAAGFNSTKANAVSADGSTAVGYCYNFDTSESSAFRWTQANGLRRLNPTPGGTSSSAALAARADGNVIVGWTRNASEPAAFATIWIAGVGTNNLANYLAAHGVDTAGFTLETATSISADGSVIAGNGTINNQQTGWVATIPAPCLGDLNLDGNINTQDLTMFLGAFGQTGPIGANGDLNADGVVNTTDLVTFLGAFGTTCGG